MGTRAAYGGTIALGITLGVSAISASASASGLLDDHFSILIPEPSIVLDTPGHRLRLQLPAAFGTLAAGTNQSTATPVPATAWLTVISTGTGGVRLAPLASFAPGSAPIEVWNTTSSPVQVFPAAGEAFGSLAANTPLTLAPKAHVSLRPSPTKWLLATILPWDN